MAADTGVVLNPSTTGSAPIHLPVAEGARRALFIRRATLRKAGYQIIFYSALLGLWALVAKLAPFFATNPRP